MDARTGIARRRSCQLRIRAQPAWMHRNERRYSYSGAMNDQQRSTPQPFDDGPRSAVDPHLLPASARQPRVPTAASDATLASSTEAADSTQAASVENVSDEYDTTDEHNVTGVDATGGAAPSDGGTTNAPAADVTAQEPVAADADETAENAAHEVDPAVGSASHDPDVIDTEGVLANDPDASTDETEGTGVTTERTRLDEALERSRTIPYEKPEPATDDVAAAEVAVDSDTTITETKVIETDETVETDTVTTADDEKSDILLAAERRRDDEAFEEAMLGTTSTEGLIMPPSKRGNRTFALIMAVVTTVIFAALYAFLFASARFIFTPGAEILNDAWAFVGTAAFYVPVVLFAIVMILWSVLSNRAGWWSYLLASIVLAILAFGGHYVGIAGQEVVNGGAWSVQALFDAIRAPENLPGALLAFIAARETSGWIGGLIAARGRRLTRLNKRDADEYERRVREERELSSIPSPAPAGLK